jgi:predicted 3-demethylubiquinone-9 3-methyltransferase (glyoxalase superfamily)
MQKITPYFWFDNNAEEAVKFYTSAFKGSKILTTTRYNEASAKASGCEQGSVMTIEFELNGQKFVALNGGPVFKFTQAISFFVSCETEEEIDSFWNRFSEGNQKIFWPLQKYPWSEKYGWITDKFGFSWQITLAKKPLAIAPFLVFDGIQLGKAEDAIKYYASLFNNSQIESIHRYGSENKNSEGQIVHAEFNLSGQLFMAMDSGMPSGVNFNESLSFVVSCKDQNEVDYYWDNLSKGGDPKSQVCGWLKDKFGVSWQIVPDAFVEMMKDPKKAKKAMEAVLRMKKIIINELN